MLVALKNFRGPTPRGVTGVRAGQNCDRLASTHKWDTKRMIEGGFLAELEDGADVSTHLSKLQRRAEAEQRLAAAKAEAEAAKAEIGDASDAETAKPGKGARKGGSVAETK